MSCRIEMTAFSVPIVFASETGFAEELANTTLQDLAAMGVSARRLEADAVNAQMLAKTTPVLFLVNTTGEGDPPFAASAFRDEMMATPADLSHLWYGLLSAGDSNYPTFCGFGRRLEGWLRASGARALFETVEVDDEDEAAVARWRGRVRSAFNREHQRPRLRS